MTVAFGEKLKNKTVLCLGFFDCMHLGHMALLGRAKQIAAEAGADTALFTFENNHFALLGRGTKLLYSYDERLDLYADCGVDVVVHAMFDSEFMNVTGAEFLHRVAGCGVCHVVFGQDYTCGADRVSAAQAAEILKGYGVACTIVPQVDVDGKKVSSSLIRGAMEAHDVAFANSLLSVPYSVCGNVVHGRQVASVLGFPTANIDVSTDKLLVDGVYCGYAYVDGERYKAIVNIGGRPTYGISAKGVEAHLVGYDGNLYGKKLRVFITSYLREIRRFSNEKQLALQLQSDLQAASNL